MGSGNCQIDVLFFCWLSHMKVQCHCILQSDGLRNLYILRVELHFSNLYREVLLLGCLSSLHQLD
ncbi:unnamed protein product [Coffea canephora]|uniref:Uncharacterized protein n=1 Tax=Coffea canephora TaxID=49390 RepID=A0A068V6F9_COFCA|nr:unnamed protein product [Coffea canephora]